PALGRAGRQRTPRELIEVAGAAVVQVAFGHPAAISSRTLDRSHAQVGASDDAATTSADGPTRRGRRDPMGGLTARRRVRRLLLVRLRDQRHQANNSGLVVWSFTTWPSDRYQGETWMMDFTGERLCRSGTVRISSYF